MNTYRRIVIISLVFFMICCCAVSATTQFDGNTLSVLYLNGTAGSKTITDEIGGTMPWTASGNANISTQRYIFGGASLFNTIDSASAPGYIQTSNSTAFNFGTSDFTIEASIYPTSVYPGQGIGTLMSSAPSNAYYCGIISTLGDASLFNTYIITSSGTSRLGTANLPINHWYNVSYVRQSGNLTMYVNGISNGSFNDAGSFSLGPAYIGHDGVDTRFDFRGWIDNIRVSNIARYTGNYVPTNVEWGQSASAPDTNSTIYLLPNPQTLVTGNYNNVTLNVNNLTSTSQGVLANISFNASSVSVSNVYINSSLSGASLISTINNPGGFVLVNITKTYLNASSVTPLVDIQFNGIDASNSTVPLNYISAQYFNSVYSLSSFAITNPGSLSMVAAPSASFSASTSSGSSPLSVTFTDTSSGSPSYWNWSFQGYGTNTTHVVNWSTSQNTTATFTTGNFSISHGAGNSNG